MAGTIKGITIEIGGNTQPLNKSLEGVNKKTRDLQSELKQVERLLKLDPGNTELLAQKQKLLADAVENSADKLKQLKAAQEQVNAQFAKGDINEEQYRAFQREVAAAEQQLNKFEGQLKEVGSTAKKSSLDIAGMGDKLKGVGEKMSLGVTAPLVAGFALVTEGTKELRGDLATLSTNANMAGQDMGILNDAMVKLQAVTGETDSNVEGLSELLATGFRDEKLSKLLESLYGASIKFKDTMKFEGIADGLQETLATGAAVGPFGELLERSGVKLKEFNAGLATAIKNGTEEQYILDVLAKTGLAETYEAYRKNNEEMVKAEEANFRMQQAMAKLGATLEPILTPLIDGITNLVNKFNEADPAIQKIILTIAGVAAAIGPLLIVIGSAVATIGPLIASFGGAGAAVGGLGAAFAVLTGPIGIAIAAIIAIGLVIADLWKNNEEFRTSVQHIWKEISQSIKQAIDQITAWWKEWGPTIMAIVTPMWETVKTIITTVLKVIGEVISLFLNVMTGDWEGAAKNITGIAQALWDGVKGITQGMADTMSGIWDLIIQTASNRWNTLKETILSPITAAKDTILGIISSIVNAFANMRIEIPRPKLPDIDVTWQKIGVGKAAVSIPHFDIDWYKTGGIFSSPSIIGVGEAGQEAVIPLDKLPSMISSALKEALGGDQFAMAGGGVTVQNMYVRNDQDIKLIAQELFNLQQSKSRGKGLK